MSQVRVNRSTNIPPMSRAASTPDIASAVSRFAAGVRAMSEAVRQISGITERAKSYVEPRKG